MKGSFSQLASILNLSTSNPNINFNGISIDSRTIKKGNLFIAIKGDKFDGNNYIRHAISKGAKVIIHSRPYKKN